MNPRGPSPAIRNFFAGLCEYAFHARLGVADPLLVDYVTELLTRFVHCDQVYRIRTPTGQRLDQVVDMVAEAEARRGDARRDVHRHIGDFTLFWSGVYPESLKAMRNAGKKDNFIDYQAQGKRAYQIAGTIPSERNVPRGEVLMRLSEEFELCAYGLGEVRREWERRDDSGEAPLPLWFN